MIGRRRPPAAAPADQAETVLRTRGPSPTIPETADVSDAGEPAGMLPGGGNETVIRTAAGRRGLHTDSGETTLGADDVSEARLPEKKLAVPVYRPRRGARPYVASAGLVLVGLAVGYFVHPSSRSPVPAAPVLSVTGISVMPPGRLTCPVSVVHIVATVDLSAGGGLLTWQWRLPDGSTSTSQSLKVTASEHSVTVPLDYTVNTSGTVTFSGEAQLHILAPSDVYSAAVPISLSCR